MTSIFEDTRTESAPATWPGADSSRAHAAFEEHARRSPDAVALVFGECVVTYGELDAEADRIARRLRVAGIGPDARVGVCVERGPALVAALLGAWKAGGAYVPLDPAYPRERLAYMAADAGLGALVVEEGTRALFADVAAPLVVLGEEDDDADAILPSISADNLAYVIYTSGSTGRPKGVMVPHSAVVAFLAAMRSAPGLDASDALLAVTTAGFDISVLELFLPLSVGARVVIADRETAADGTRLRRLIEHGGATVMQATPATWRMLIDAGWTPSRHLTLLSGGDALPADVARALTAGGAALWNLYGPTETTVWSTRDRVEDGRPITIGQAIEGTRAETIDGELFIGGAGVTRGYLGRPGLTAERFVPDPVVPGARMYRTGDGARLRPDGRLDFLGRLDAQVKVRGHRVEPGEIEAALAAIPGVRQAVVAARDDGDGARLVAYLVGDVPAAAELRTALRGTLPEYMVPSAFVRLDAIPLTASGKTDRRALPAPPTTGEAEYRAPSTELETTLTDAWREVLGVARVGLDDDFFDLGGHSLLATRVLSRVRQRWGVELPVRAVFEHPTVALLAAAVEAARDAGGAAPQPPLVPAGRDVPLPLSFSQQRLWFLSELEPASALYNLPAAVRLRGELEEAALRRALGEIVRRHEALRTTFRAGADGVPVQEVRAAPADFPLPVADLRGFPAPWARAEVLRLAADEAEAPFDLRRDPLLRALLVRVAPDEHALVFTLHHIAGDAWSVGVLFAELAALYGAFRDGNDSPLAPLPVQYPDYAAWQRAWLADRALDAQLAYWRARLAGAPALLELPADHPRPPAQSHRGEVLAFEVPASLARAARSLARREDATPFMVLLAAFSLVLHRLSGSDDLVVGAPVAGRARPEVEGLIGFFVNTMALRVDASGDPSFRELLRRVRETTLEAYAHQDLPFDRVVEELHPQRTLGYNPLFQVALALQNVPRAASGPAGLTLELDDVDSGTAKFDLFLELVEEGDRLRAKLEYATDLWNEAGAGRITTLFLRLLGAAVAEPDVTLTRLGAVGGDECDELLALGAGAGAESVDVPVHARVAEQARARPDAAAVRADGRSLSYGELDAAANRLANHLRALGVGAESVVGVCLERGADLVIAALAAMRAGAAYLPLDPSLPPARIAAMVADAGAAVVVTGERFRDGVGGTVVSVDGDAAEIARRSDADPDVPASPDALAYVVFTSGSTGRPKGVAVPHRGLSNLVAWHIRAFGVAPGDRASVMAGVGFDASVWEMWPYLAAGAALHIVPAEVRGAPVELRAWLAEQGITVAFAPTPVAELLLDGDWAAPPRLRALLVGGDRLRARPPAHLPFIVHNNYGPTEASVVATSGVVAAGGAGLPDIGGPTDGARLYVVDGALGLVTRGAPGELLVGGAGVARGYIGRPALTAERFVPDPHSATPGARAYRTGDRVRWRGDGTLEFLGRLDRQIKVRGHRIEPGEVEAVLAAHPGVAAAIVEPRSGSTGTTLAAYLVPRRVSADEHAPVERWEALFENVYGAPEPATEDAALDTTGWNSSYTGQPIPAAEMREWAERTAERIAALRPRRVLEVGVGTGMLLLRIAPLAERYVGTDFSAHVLATVRGRVDAARGLPPVALLHREADDFAGLDAERFDTAILNSVCQYFPGAEYLARVVAGAIGKLDDGGAFFVGDVRNLETLEAFRAAVEFDSAPDSASVAELRRRVRRVLEEEAELVVHPDFFAALRIPRLARVEARIKRGFWHNELTRHRYDVVLRVGPPPAAETALSVDWDRDGITLDAIRERANAVAALAILGVPDARVARELAIAALVLRADDAPETVGDARALLDAFPTDATDPETLWALGDELGLEVEIRPARGGRFDALLRPAGSAASFPERPIRPRPLREYANDPLWGQHVRDLVPELRAHLAERLPEHMVPHALVLLDALPLTPNGKIDRRALPDPEPVRLGAEMAPPRTDTEREMAALWADLLRLDAVYATDNFFDLGGHSLLATQLVTRIREAFGLGFPLQRIFEAPTVAALAAMVDAERTAIPAPSDGPRPRRRDGNEAPASFAQARLWVIDRMEPGGAFYTMTSPLRMRGALDVAALERALNAIRKRHEALRTTFAERAGAPIQIIHPFAPVPLAVDDLAVLSTEEREAEVARRVHADANTGFDLVAGPLFRAHLLRLAPDEHVLLMCLHHIVSDGWSMGVLAAELGALYEAFHAGHASPLAPLPVQYADFAAWQREQLSGAELERQLAFWRAELDDAPPALELPTDRPRPPAQSHRGRVLKSRIAPEIADGMRALARREGATLFHVLLAGVRLLMGRWAGQDDVVIGTPVAGRTRRETEGLIGFFVNTLPLRGSLGGDPAFAELVRRERERTVAASDHQDLPFERMVEELRVARDPGRNPLFQVMAVLQNARMDAARMAGVEITPLDVEYDTAKFDLIFDAYEEDGGALRLEVEYATDLFDASTVQRMASALGVLLDAAGARPDSPAHALPLLAPEERAGILSMDSAAAPAAGTVDALLAAQAERTPDDVALEAAGESLTYRELHARANRLAHRLRALGVGPESRVGVCAGRTAGMVAGLLGVLKAGAAYLPLDPAYPADRLAFMLEDTGARVVLADASTESRVPAGVTVVRVDDASLDALPADAPAASALPENLAWVIFTSGSTGRPKGVMIRHASAAAFLDWMRREFPLTAGERVLGATSVSFDVHVAEIHFALVSGATIVLVQNALALAEPGVGAGVAHAAMVPAAAAELLRLGALPAGLRTLILGGESLPAALARDVHAATGVERLGNGFGPTEDTTYSTVAIVPADAERVAVGPPIGGGRAYILDTWMEPVPVGVPGELWLAGAGLARGYLDRPALTAERFIPCPFGAPGERMYRTGDRARRLPNGELESLGRLDEQVKVRGFRIEPGEVESVLAAHPAVFRAVVVARGEVGERRLVAYIVPRDGMVDSAELRAHAAAHLPEHMVPGAWVTLDALPLTPSGKVDRRALPEPDAPIADTRAAPRTPTEEVLAAIFAEVLGVGAVGRDDGFFELGGHSLLAAQVTSRVRAALQVELPLREIFEAPSVAALAERVDAERRRLGGVPDAPIERVDRSAEIPLSFSQERLWFLARLQPDSPAYNMPFIVRMSGALEVAALRRALGEVTRRHETLRTVFRAGARGPVQVILPPAEIDLPTFDASHFPAAEREAEVARWAAERGSVPFDLAAAAPVRFAMARVDARDHRLLLTLHHVCADGWSLDRLFGELGALYSAFSRGESSPLAELPTQYADFAAWQRGWLQGDTLDRQLAYWKTRLAGAPAIELPADHPRPAVPSNRGGMHLVPLPAAVEDGLAALARRDGATSFMALLAGFTLLLRRWSGQDDIVVGTPVAGRTRPEVEGLIGFFVNTVVLRADVSGDPTFAELLARVRAVALDAYAHQDLPFERLVDELKTERQLSRHPVFQVVFSVQQPEPVPAAGPDLSMRVGFTDTGTTKFDLMVMLERRRDGSVLSLEYARDLFEPETIRRMGSHLAALLAAAAAEPDAPVSSLMARLDDDDRRTMLVDWNPPIAAHAGSAHGAFQAIASVSPDALAVIGGADSARYGELNVRANRLARHLRALGVGAESRVGVVAGGALTTTEAMLGVLKAGGAFVVIDPEMPPARLRHILGDADLAALVVPSASLLDRLPRIAVSVVALDRDAARIAEHAADDLALDVDPDTLAAIVYSSGSTSLPRGVLLTHRAVATAARALAENCGIGATSRVLGIAPLAHARGLTATFAALSAGASLVFAARDGVRDAVRRGRVTHAIAPPAILAALSDADLPDLQMMVATGDTPNAALAGRWARDGRTLRNAYVHAEAGLAVAAARVEADGAPSIGRAIGGARAYVLDDALRPLPPGVPGELYIGGGVARGYQGRPGLTAAHFVPDPFADGGRMVRTGDRARWRPDGTLEVLERAVSIVRGHRVEPRHVAAALAALPGVRDAVAVVRSDGRLAAYVTALAGADPRPDALRDALRDRLEEALIPSAVVILPEMPLTAAGRVDARALPAPDLARAAEPTVAPRGEMERVIAEVWREVLGGGAVGVHDNFFEIGGHSLLLARLQERLEARLSREVRMVELFRYPTVGAYAAFLGQSPAAPQAAPKRGIDRGAARREVLSRRGR